MQTTSDRLAQIMKERGLTQVDVVNLCKPFCDKYGVKLGKSHVSQYISGVVVPSQHKLSILGMALGVSETWLMGYDVPRDREDSGFIARDAEENKDISDLLEALRSRPEMRMLFSVSKDATKEDIEKAVAIIEALRKTEGR